MKTKSRVVLYHDGPKFAAEANDRAKELRAEGFVARTIDAQNFSDIEDTDKIDFVGDFPDQLKDIISKAYAPVDPRVFSREVSEHEGPVIDIPQNWSEMSFPELQKLAAAISDEAVRTKEQAMEIIAAEVDRREAQLDTDDNDSDEDELEKMTKAELIDYASEKKIDLDGASKKAEILAAIRAATKE